MQKHVFYLALLGPLLQHYIASSLPVEKPRITGTTAALMYLSRFGYMDPSATHPQSSALLSEEAVKQSIMEFQAFAGLNQTGKLDDETLVMMNTPRCGVKDKVGYGANARRKRYALQGSRWKVRDLTYKISKYPRGLSMNEVDKEIDASFQTWAGVTDLTFNPVGSSDKVHIDIRFEVGEHGDGDPFDGPGGTLAHAYFPIYGGDAHFDDTETWSIRSYRGTNLFQVASHELGHSLGLSHSDITGALMAPFYRGYEPKFKLHKDDIDAIQALYGTKSTELTPTGETSPTQDSILCHNASIDAIVTMADKKTYVFKGSFYWRLTSEGIEEGYPKKITDWGDLPSDMDAAFTWTNGKTYFFKGSKYWRLTEFVMDTGYPKSISSGFAGIPDNIDAAFVWSGNGKIYFFKGSKYWRFDPSQRPPVRKSYPKPITNWVGIPNGIDDALQYSNSYTYFFKNGKYWRFNDRGFSVDTDEPSYPRPVNYWWFGCSASESQSQAVRKSSSYSSHDENEITGDSLLDADGPPSSGGQRQLVRAGTFQGYGNNKSCENISNPAFHVIALVMVLFLGRP